MRLAQRNRTHVRLSRCVENESHAHLLQNQDGAKHAATTIYLQSQLMCGYAALTAPMIPRS